MNRNQAEALVYELLLEADRNFDIVIPLDKAQRLARRIVDALMPKDLGAP